MDKLPQSRAPLNVAIVLLLLPVLYVGTYLAIVDPPGHGHVPKVKLGNRWFQGVGIWVHYRAMPEQAARFFWPLEQIDRKVRPRAWNSGSEKSP